MITTSLVNAAAAYYTSFASVGIVIYFIRTMQGYRSLPEAINERYGSMATLAFGLAVLFRLYQEVWSNALVVAGFYGAVVCNPSALHSGQTASVCCCCCSKYLEPMLIWVCSTQRSGGLGLACLQPFLLSIPSLAACEPPW